jgi:hypothetical protein
MTEQWNSEDLLKGLKVYLNDIPENHCGDDTPENEINIIEFFISRINQSFPDSINWNNIVNLSQENPTKSFHDTLEAMWWVLDSMGYEVEYDTFYKETMR